MINELIFLSECLLLGILVLGAIRLGKEAVVAAVCMFSFLSNLFVLKQIALFGLTVTSSDAFTIGAMLSLNALQEFWGKEIAKKAIIVNSVGLILYALFTYFHLLYIPAICDATHEHFVAILSMTPRIIGASVFVYFCVQIFDYFFYAFLKRNMANKFLVVRNYCSLAVSQLIDTILFSFLGLYGIVAHIGHVIAISYCIKIVVIILAVPFIKYAASIVRSSHDAI